MVSNIQNMENLNPQVLRLIGKEIQSLKMDTMEGISVVLDDKDLTRLGHIRYFIMQAYFLNEKIVFDHKQN